MPEPNEKPAKVVKADKSEKGVIRVRGALGVKPDGSGEVVLFERDERHPGGEAFVAGLDEVDVFPTPRVTALIREGKLEEV